MDRVRIVSLRLCGEEGVISTFLAPDIGGVFFQAYSYHPLYFT